MNNEVGLLIALLLMTAIVLRFALRLYILEERCHDLEETVVYLCAGSERLSHSDDPVH